MKKRGLFFKGTVASLGMLMAASSAMGASMEQENRMIEAEASTLKRASTYTYKEIKHQLNHCYAAYGAEADYYRDRNIERERMALELLDETTNGWDDLELQAVKFYIAYPFGSSAHLGMGERAGVLNTWQQVYDKKIPTNDTEWQDMLRMGAGRWPHTRVIEREELAVERFTQVYDRVPNFDNENDESAVMILAYGLRPNERNMDSEEAALATYMDIFEQAPETAGEWDVVRAIAYSGAVK